jgi:uncharacterized membrane protein
VFVLFAPGYAFIAALFPEAGEGPTEDGSEDAIDATSEGIDGIERLTLSLGTSIAIVPLIGLVLNFTPFGIRLTPIVVSLSAFTLLVTAIGASRRWQLPVDDRFSIPYRDWGMSTRTELFEPDSRGDAVLNVFLVLSLLLAVSSVGYGVMVPTDGESFSELYLLTESDSGALVADDYPTNLTVGESESLHVGIGNHENTAVNYTIVAELQRVNVTYLENGTVIRPTANGTNVTNVTVDVLEREEIERFSPRIQSNATWVENHTIAPQMSGERLRLVYLLYKGDPPATPTAGNAYREVHLWVNVSDGTPPQPNMHLHSLQAHPPS